MGEVSLDQWSDLSSKLTTLDSSLNIFCLVLVYFCVVISPRSFSSRLRALQWSEFVTDLAMEGVLLVDPSKWSPIKNMISVIRRQKQQHRRSRQQKWNYFGALPKTKERTEYFFWQNNKEGSREDAITNCKSLYLAIKTVGGPRAEVEKTVETTDLLYYVQDKLPHKVSC